MTIREVKVSDLLPATYNPRKDLQPNDTEYKKLKNSIEEFGYIEPIIWNEKTGNLVGGHQRLKVLTEQGHTKVDVVVVNLEDRDEKILNVSLNKVKGRWDIGALSDIMHELDELSAVELSGFDDWEIENLFMQYDHIKDLMQEDFGGFDDAKEKSTFVMTFSLPGSERESIEKYVQQESNSKEKLAEAVMSKVKEEMV